MPEEEIAGDRLVDEGATEAEDSNDTVMADEFVGEGPTNRRVELEEGADDKASEDVVGRSGVE